MSRHTASVSHPHTAAQASAGNQSGTRYPVPAGLALAVAASLVAGRRRNFSADARRLARGFAPPPRVEDAHWVPRSGPFVLATNHFFKTGYKVWWGIILLAASVAEQRPGAKEMIWMQANRWTYPDPLRSRIVTPLTKIAFTRLAHMYGFVSTPPMPHHPEYVEEGAQSVRRILALLDPDLGAERPAIGIAPEGRDGEDGSLIRPPAGVGRLLLHMSKRGLSIVPAGVAEIDGVLTARFGPPFSLVMQTGLGKDEQDRRASAEVMSAIGRLLPRELWGVYAAQIEPRT